MGVGKMFRELKLTISLLAIILSTSNGQEVKDSLEVSISNDSFETDNLKSWPLRVPVDPLLSAHYQSSAQRTTPANLTQELSQLELVEETTSRPTRQVGTGILFRNSAYNPALTPSFNPYSPANQVYNPVNGAIDPLTGVGGVSTFDTGIIRDDTGLDGFTARRASAVSQGRGARIIFTDTVSELGTSWDSGASEFSPTIAGYFFFTFNAISDRYSYFRISLQLNGVDVVSAFSDISGYQMAGNSAMIRMDPGDKVYLTLQEGRLYEVSSSRAYTTFSGFRVL